MTVITGDIAKNAVLAQLLKKFPDVYAYKEASADIGFPQFFVHQLNFTDTQDRKDYHLLHYLMNVRYRVAGDPSTELKLAQKLDGVALKLHDAFHIIPFGDGFVKCGNKEIEKQDGVLHFNFTIDVMCRVLNDTGADKMNKLVLVVEAKK